MISTKPNPSAGAGPDNPKNQEKAVRAWQIRLVAGGMLGLCSSLAGVVVQQAWLAMAGLAVFLLALISIFVLGAIAWWKFG